MQRVTKEQVVRCLRELGIIRGDGLLVHSALQYLGYPVGGVGMYLEAIQSVIGAEGTVAVPTFNFAFARGEPYDPHQTPSQGMGVFAEYVRKHPNAQRTPHPMQSLAVLGRWADDFASRDTASAFDPGSAFERMLELDFKILLLGADFHAISMTHYCEQRAHVPYRYWKEFEGDVRTPNGWERRKYKMFVRDLDLNPELTLTPLLERLQARGQWLSVPLNYGEVTSCKVVHFVNALDEILASDPWALVVNRP